MIASDVFGDEGKAEQSQAVSLNLWHSLEGLSVEIGLAALFVTFVSICKNSGADAGACFDDMLACLEGRKKATHAAPKSLQ